eukprot:1912192-Pyramimonas_sp.AAC.1
MRKSQANIAAVTKATGALYDHLGAAVAAEDAPDYAVHDKLAHRAGERWLCIGGAEPKGTPLLAIDDKSGSGMERRGGEIPRTSRQASALQRGPDLQGVA